MGLSAEKKAQLEALLAENDAATEDDEFDNEEIEVWNEKGAGARLRGRHSRTWLIDNGFLKDRSAAPTEPETDLPAKTAGRKSKGPAAGARPGTATKYFGAK